MRASQENKLHFSRPHSPDSIFVLPASSHASWLSIEMALAQIRSACLILFRVQLDRTIRALRKLVKPALAGGLAVLLLFTTTASASHLLHRTLHSGDSANHNCLVCL